MGGFGREKYFLHEYRKVIDRYSQVIYIAHINRSLMPSTKQLHSKNFSMRDCAGKGGIIDGD
jgi:hypothetical protein